MVTPWEEPGASIHQRRRKVLSEPCWIVTHHMAIQPNLYCLWCRICNVPLSIHTKGQLTR